MQMMKCPHCGADNSDKRSYCYQCDGDLRGKPKEDHAYVPTCQTCSKANIFPPPGFTLARGQVWCLEREEVLAGERIAGTCFDEAFGWQRDKILD